MKIRLITLDILDIERQQRELNAFLASHTVLAVTKELVRLGERAYWTFCIEYSETAGPVATDTSDKKPKVDYRELLSPEEFDLYSRLRDVRKRLAEREDVPVYTVLTNAQLAEVVQNRITTSQGLSAIKGVGEARAAKFGDELLACLRDSAEGAAS